MPLTKKTITELFADDKKSLQMFVEGKREFHGTKRMMNNGETWRTLYTFIRHDLVMMDNYATIGNGDEIIENSEYREYYEIYYEEATPSQLFGRDEKAMSSFIEGKNLFAGTQEKFYDGETFNVFYRLLDENLIAINSYCTKNETDELGAYDAIIHETESNIIFKLK